jgi:hypothetical protein
MVVLVILTPLAYLLTVVALGIILALAPAEARLPRAVRGLRLSVLVFVASIVPGVVGDFFVQRQRPSVPQPVLGPFVTVVSLVALVALVAAAAWVTVGGALSLGRCLRRALG